jgi:hypothetical protein
MWSYFIARYDKDLTRGHLITVAASCFLENSSNQGSLKNIKNREITKKKKEGGFQPSIP